MDGHPLYTERYYTDLANEPVDTCDFSEQAQVVFSLMTMMEAMRHGGSLLGQMLSVADQCVNASLTPAWPPSAPALPSFGNASMLSSFSNFLGQFES